MIDNIDVMNPAVSNTPSKKEQKLDSKGRAYATGKRKSSVSRVWIKPGSGKILVNGEDQNEYFARAVLRMIIAEPFKVANRDGQYDVFCTVKGGGLSGQAGAVRHGISKALDAFEPELHKVLKQVGFLTRDSRVVERKKYGRRKARDSSSLRDNSCESSKFESYTKPCYLRGFVALFSRTVVARTTLRVQVSVH